MVLTACLVLPSGTLLALHLLAWVISAPQTGSNQPTNMGATINSTHREAEPSFTADGHTMYFNCNSGDICVSHLVGTWEEAQWTPPEPLPVPVNTEYEEVEPVINAAGDKLYFTSIRPRGRLSAIPFLSPFVTELRFLNSLAAPVLGRTFFGGLGMNDVYVTFWAGGVWSAPAGIHEVAGEPAINTPFADHCLFFSADENEAFWTSTRPGGFGDNDIWTSRKVAGKWTAPENLGPNINSRGSEHTSNPTPDGRSLYVTATRPGGFGGDDIYVSTRGSDGAWGPLANLGPLVNGPGDDRCPAWTPDLQVFLFDSVRAGGLGGRDIWWVDFKEVMGYPGAVHVSRDLSKH